MEFLLRCQIMQRYATEFHSRTVLFIPWSGASHLHWCRCCIRGRYHDHWARVSLARVLGHTDTHLPLEITAHISRTTRPLLKKVVEEMMLWRTTHHIRHIVKSTRRAALRLFRRFHLCVNDCSIYLPQLDDNMSILMSEFAMPLSWSLKVDTYINSQISRPQGKFVTYTVYQAKANGWPSLLPRPRDIESSIWISNFHTLATYHYFRLLVVLVYLPPPFCLSFSLIWNRTSVDWYIFFRQR